MELVGRHEEKRILAQVAEASQPQMLAVYGRRRVGKTYLVRNHFSNHELFVEITGKKGANMAGQIRGFTDSVSRAIFGGVPLKPASNWRDALELITKHLEQKPSKQAVIFFD